MNIRIFSFPVFSFQFNLNNTEGVATNKTRFSVLLKFRSFTKSIFLQNKNYKRIAQAQGKKL